MSGLGLAGRGRSVATGIRGGRIVGNIPGGAFVLVGGELTLLPLIPGASSNEARAVNGAGVIVGNTITESVGSQNVTMWTPE